MLIPDKIISNIKLITETLKIIVFHLFPIVDWREGRLVSPKTFTIFSEMKNSENSMNLFWSFFGRNLSFKNAWNFLKYSIVSILNFTCDLIESFWCTNWLSRCNVNFQSFDRRSETSRFLFVDKFSRLWNYHQNFFPPCCYSFP